MLLRSAKQYVHSRHVYTIVDSLRDIGGFAVALLLITWPVFSFFSSSMLNIAILNENFKYDNGNYRTDIVPIELD